MEIVYVSITENMIDQDIELAQMQLRLNRIEETNIKHNYSATNRWLKSRFI